MSKIYYMKRPVEIGEEVEHNGMVFEVTEQLVKNNPDVFEVREEQKIFTTYDGVDIYEGDNFWIVDKNQLVLLKWILGEGSDVYKFKAPKGAYMNDVHLNFSSRKAAEEYIEKHKEKTLEDYESQLIHACYLWLKNKEPKLYWTKVLELIAEDLNDKFKQTKSVVFSIIYIKGNYNRYFTESHSKTHYQNSVRFLSREAADKAIQIMGDKLDYIYK